MPEERYIHIQKRGNKLLLVRVNVISLDFPVMADCGVNFNNTRFSRFSSGPKITCLLLGYAKISSKSSRSGTVVRGESSR